MKRIVDVSIIIPVYNTEKYIRRCLDSLINQTLENIEIICVNDGSTDKSLDILKEYELKDDRIKVIDQPNLKQGRARNCGVKNAQGEYIGFVDSDDYVAEDYFEKLYKTVVQYNADISCSSIVRVKEKTEKYRLLYKDTKCVNQLKDKLEICTSIGDDYIWNVWNKLYKKSFLIENNILFEEGVYFEDVNYTIQALHKSNYIVTVPNTYYYYCARKNSVVKSLQDKRKRDNLFNTYAKFWAYCNKHNIDISNKNSYCTQIYLRILNIILFSRKLKYNNNQIIQKYKLFNVFTIFAKTITNPFIAYDYPVDIVYCWCDGNDSAFKAEKEFWQNKLGIKIADNNFNCQWLDNDELKYSIRSVEKYAPWIRNIYIITNSQRPVWLKDSINIKIVDVSDIMPQDALPTFNSQAIETAIPYIEGLSEHFLYSNDDMFFNNFVEKSFFFNKKGKPIVRLQGKISAKTLTKSLYARTIVEAQKKVNNLYNIKYEYSPHHCIDSYTKTSYLNCINDFKEDFEKTQYQKFRCEESIQRAIILYRALATGEAVLRFTKLFNIFTRDSKCIALNTPKKLKYLNNNSVKLFCINDDAKATDDDKKVFKCYLENKFKDKSKFEL